MYLQLFKPFARDANRVERDTIRIARDAIHNPRSHEGGNLLLSGTQGCH